MSGEFTALIMPSDNLGDEIYSPHMETVAPEASEERSKGPPADIVDRVIKSFLICKTDELLVPLNSFLSGTHAWTPLVRDAADGFQSVINAASLPFELIHDAVQQRRFDRLLSAERIRNLRPPGETPPADGDERALERARDQMRAFLESPDGSDYMRDGMVYELDRSLESRAVKTAAAELLIQTLVSTWTVFESFARSFVVTWINTDPRRAKPVLASPDLKDYFGKQVVDIEVIGEHGFDLTSSMGDILFRGKRLDNLPVIRSTMEALFNDANVRSALGDDLWMLNQRRHLFVHKRGLVDQEYLKRTGDKASLGQRLSITSYDVERYFRAVRQAVIAIATAAESQTSSS